MIGIRVLLVAAAAVAFVAALAPLSDLNAYVGQNPYSVSFDAPSGAVSCATSPSITATVRDAETGNLVSGQSIRWDIKKGQSSADSVSPRNTVTDNNGKSTVTLHFGPVEGERTVRAVIATWPATVRVTCRGGGAGSPPPATRTPGPTPTDGPTNPPTATPTRTPTATPVDQTPTPTPVDQTPTPTPVDQTPTPVGETPTPVGQTPDVGPSATPDVPASSTPDPGLPTSSPSFDPGTTGSPAPTGLTPSTPASSEPSGLAPGETVGPGASEVPGPGVGEGSATSDVIPILLLVLVIGGLGALGLVAVMRR